VQGGSVFFAAGEAVAQQGAEIREVAVGSFESVAVDQSLYGAEGIEDEVGV